MASERELKSLQHRKDAIKNHMDSLIFFKKHDRFDVLYSAQSIMGEMRHTRKQEEIMKQLRR